MTSRPPRPRLELAHHHPGRLRLRSDALCAKKGDDSWTTRLESILAKLADIAGVDTVRHNQRSGSILVEYQPGAVEPDALIDLIAAAGELELVTFSTVPTPARIRPASYAIRAVRKLNALTADATGGRMDLRSAVPLAMAGAAVYSFVNGKNRMPRWDNLAYWGYAIFQSLHASEIANAAPGEPL